MLPKKYLPSIKKIFLLLISLAISSLLCECILRIVAPQDLSGTWRIHTEKGLSVTKSSGSSRHQYGKRIVTYNFYKPHLRDTPLKEGGIKVLTVGDSFTFGLLLDKKDTFIYHLQEYADKQFGKNRFYFLNAGAGGWGTSDYVAFIEDFGELIKPDIVLVFINTDDIGRSIESGIFTLSSEGNFNLERHIFRASYLKKFVNSIPGYQWFLEHSHLLQLLRKSYLSLSQYKYKKDIKKVSSIADEPNSYQSKISRQYSIKLGRALFSRLKKWCDTHGVDLYVTTTGWHQLEGAYNSTEPTKAYMSTAQEFFTDIKVPFFDISPLINELKRKTKKQYILEERHPNEQANRLIAETVWRNFLKQQFIEYHHKISQ